MSVYQSPQVLKTKRKVRDLCLGDIFAVNRATLSSDGFSNNKTNRNTFRVCRINYCDEYMCDIRVVAVEKSGGEFGAWEHAPKARPFTITDPICDVEIFAEAEAL